MIWRLNERLERVRLRPFQAKDVTAFFAYRSDPDVARLQGWEPMSEHDALEFVVESGSASGFAIGQWTQIAIAELSSDRLIGDIGVYLSTDQATAEFGITITPYAQGHGYATESIQGLIRLVFSSTSVETVQASTDALNGPCISALSRAGMRIRETRQAKYKGTPCSEVVFSIHKSEYQRSLCSNWQSQTEAS